MKKDIINNQALYQHMLFFDPLNKKVALKDGGGDITERIYYVDEKPGVRLLENGDVEFNYYAPEAKSVKVKGIGGSMSQEYDLEPVGDGYWKVVAQDIAPGFHYHIYIVDGVQTTNQLGQYGYGCFYSINFLKCLMMTRISFSYRMYLMEILEWSFMSRQSREEPRRPGFILPWI